MRHEDEPSAWVSAPRSGAVLPPWSRRRRLSAVLFGACLVMYASGCESDAAESRTAGGARVMLLHDRVDPPDLLPVAIDRSVPISAFDIENVTVGPVTHVFWYYDYEDSGLPMTYYALCGSTSKCTFSVCAKPRSTAEDHRLTVVVSDGPLAADAKSPFSFPEGTHFDALTWQLKLMGQCP